MRKRSGEGQGMKAKRPEFMGYAVSIPQYLRLQALQDITIKMDRYMKQLAMLHSRAALNTDPSWRELEKVAYSLVKFLPPEIKAANREVVWWY